MALDVMSKNKENIFKSLILLMGVGVLLYIVVALICIGIGWILSLIFGWPWYISAAVLFCLFNAIGGMDFEGDSKCTECKRKILTSISIKCEVCGGPARLTKREYKKVVKNQIYERKEKT